AARSACPCWRDPPTTEIYPLSLHDALPICRYHGVCCVEPTPLFLVIPGMAAILGHRPLDQRRQMHTAAHALVVEEMQLRNGAQFHHPPELHSQETRSILERLQILGNILGAGITHEGNEHLGVRQVTTDLGRGDCDHAHPGIAHFALDQQRQFALHLIGHALGTAVISGHISEPLAASLQRQAANRLSAADSPVRDRQTTSGPSGPPVAFSLCACRQLTVYVPPEPARRPRYGRRCARHCSSSRRYRTPCRYALHRRRP